MLGHIGVKGGSALVTKGSSSKPSASRGGGGVGKYLYGPDLEQSNGTGFIVRVGCKTNYT